MSAFDLYVGRNLRQARKLAGMSQTQAAEVIGVSYQQMQKYEKGVNRISTEFAKKLATAFSVSFESLTGQNSIGDDNRDGLALLRIFNKLDPQSKMALLGVGRAMLKSLQPPT